MRLKSNFYISNKIPPETPLELYSEFLFWMKLNTVVKVPADSIIRIVTTM